MAGHVLVTLREAFAVAPGVDAARVIAVRRGGPDIYGRADADAGNILAGTATELVLNQKRGQILPVDLSTEPEIRDLLSAFLVRDCRQLRVLGHVPAERNRDSKASK